MKTLNVFFMILIAISITINLSNVKKILRKNSKNNNETRHIKPKKQTDRDYASDIFDDEEQEDEENDSHFDLSEADIMADNDEGEEDNQDFDDFTKNYKKYKHYGDLVITTY